MCAKAELEVHEIIRRGHSNKDVNCHMCWVSDTGKAIKKKQKSSVYHGAGFHHDKYNFKKACETQMHKKKVCNL